MTMETLTQRVKHFVGGGWVDPQAGGRIEVRSPFDSRLVGVSADGTSADMDRAVLAARRAFDHGPWPYLDPNERANVLEKMAAYLRERAQQTVDLVVAEMGAPKMFLTHGAESVADLFSYYAGLARETPLEVARQGAYAPARVRKEPVGVVAAIAPWNGPMYIMALKIAPALAAGCTLVAKIRRPRQPWRRSSWATLRGMRVCGKGY
jgi:betaine-aldehyde dehydrogenase